MLELRRNTFPDFVNDFLGADRDLDHYFNHRPSQAAFRPRMDVYEEEKQYVVRLEVPGVKAADLDVEAKGNTLTIKGERKTETDEKRSYSCREIAAGSFTRALEFPQSVESAKISASFKDGVLELQVPKAKSAQTRKIEIPSA